ncbi:tyrosine-type recombinase/integrase [Thalassotalea mangrovi]|uniref:DUF3596 domain-containing protein n=1 Tax=Thalassotalea mangrovi TaxID=2572245 RepID=A0A4U1B2B8_9GAMM|nr:tyrosine-type recombinase/integrase [Thalassotalea mangrovi]TKB43541.1 DUF3596 domain-containing protein [Thalassotalea mangrovi]
MTKLSKAEQKALGAARGVSVHHGNLRIQFKLPDKDFPIRKSLCYPPTKANIALAELTLANVKRDIANGLYNNDPELFWKTHFPTNHNANVKQITVRESFTDYYSKKNGSLSDSLKDKLKTAQNWLDHYRLLDKPISKISKEMLEDVRTLTASGNKKGNFQGCSASTVGEYTYTFSKVLRLSLSRGNIDVDPTIGLMKLPEDDNNHDSEDDDVRPFSQEELRSLLDVIHVPRVKLMVELLAWTGLRHGELKALAWEDISNDFKRIRVKYNLTRHANVKPAKTKAGVRTVELLPAAQKVLRHQYELTAHLAPIIDTIHYKNQKTEQVARRRVFLSRGNIPYKRPELTTVSKQWEKWMRKANLAYRPPYQLRHTYASQLLMVGANPTWLAAQMGHKDWSMISKIYGTWIPNQDLHYVDRLAKKLGQ